ncbi:invasion associated locus B family protein [Phyllobacterium leguminum]|uniref:Invasion protein IalB n=1 Tax=Phyllobacterium leguminum TaxID=314237 RepID=A0A318T7I2_9HYPH|nr:invasion associated locus B family protein [Phyllobacterium leguminum]PYE90523.1 invasion protein IalB [Phyllobacterium leguminum]
MARLAGTPREKFVAFTLTVLALVATAGSALVLTGTKPAPAQAEGPSALSETFGDWMVNCQPAADTKKRVCQMTQEQVDGKTGQRVLMIALGVPDTKTGVASSTLVLPFGLDFSKGIGIKVDDTDLARANVSTCVPQGCIAPLSFDGKALAALAKGKQAVINMTAFNGGKDVTGNLSLKGFSAASTRLAALAAS